VMPGFSQGLRARRQAGATHPPSVSRSVTPTWSWPTKVRNVPGVSTTSGFAVAATREETRWRCSLLDAEVLDDLDGLVKALRRLPSAGAAFALVAVDDEFFVVVRPVPGGVRLLLSDATAAIDYDLAEDVLEELGIPVPDD